MKFAREGSFVSMGTAGEWARARVYVCVWCVYVCVRTCVRLRVRACVSEYTRGYLTMSMLVFTFFRKKDAPV